MSLQLVTHFKFIYYMTHNISTIVALKSGDIQAFEKIYRFFYKDLLLFAQSMLMCEAENIVQDTFMWVWENRESINEKLSFKSLLFAIVKNRMLNHIHRMEIQQRTIQELAVRNDITYEIPDFNQTNEILRKYRQCMIKLSPEMQNAFKMHRYKHLSYKEIAIEQKCSIQTVNYRINRTVKALRKELL